MRQTNCVAAEVAKTTKYRSLQTAYQNGEFEVILYPRDGVWEYQGTLNDKTFGYLVKEMARLYPGCIQI